MTSVDRAGIVVTLVVVAVALGFSIIGGTGIPTDIVPVMEKSTEPLKDAGLEATEKLKDLSDSGSKIVEEVSEKTTKAAEQAKELTTSKLPARLVSIPFGTSIPGCEKEGLCYDPESLIIFRGAEVIWKNDDKDAHTVTSGNIIEGPDGLFDSGLIKSGDTFSYRFEEYGEYSYFCMIHPWAKASVTVR